MRAVSVARNPGSSMRLSVAAPMAASACCTDRHIKNAAHSSLVLSAATIPQAERAIRGVLGVVVGEVLLQIALMQEWAFRYVTSSRSEDGVPTRMTGRRTKAVPAFNKFRHVARYSPHDRRVAERQTSLGRHLHQAAPTQLVAKYQRTRRMMIWRSKCRPANNLAMRLNLLISGSHFVKRDTLNDSPALFAQNQTSRPRSLRSQSIRIGALFDHRYLESERLRPQQRRSLKLAK
jgi:hypothetical protein